jgi:hypothetical protein
MYINYILMLLTRPINNYQLTFIEEFEVIRRKNMDNDGKLSILSKKEMKAILGHSPDFADALMMRMRYMFKNGRKIMAWR